MNRKIIDFVFTFPGQDGDSQDQSKSGQESKNRIEETLHTARFIKPYRNPVY